MSPIHPHLSLELSSNRSELLDGASWLAELERAWAPAYPDLLVPLGSESFLVEFLGP